MTVKFFGGPIDGATMEPDPGLPDLSVYMWEPDEAGTWTEKSKHGYKRWEFSPYYVYDGWK